jgi:hypothetical protein
MKSIVKKMLRDEKGAALVLALILLLVGGLISAALLSHMGAGLLAGEVYGRRTVELYAADAGVEDAVWKIQHKVPEVENLTQCSDNWTYYITNANGGVAEVNDKHVEVTITVMTIVDDLPLDYRIESRAVGDGSETKIDAYVAGSITYCSILDHLVTVRRNLSEAEVELLEKDLAKLNIPCPEVCDECDKCAKAYDYYSDAYESIPQACKGCIAVYNFPEAAWPTASTLSARYLNDVKDAEKWTSTIIDLKKGDVALPALYVDGTLKIRNLSNKNVRSLTLNGTLYITGDTEIGMDGGGTNKPNFTLDLNGNTIFVASNSMGGGHEALGIGPWCTINGPGAIIAVGDIYFQPNQIIGTDQEPAFVLSVSGENRVQSGAAFVGAIAADLDVRLQSGGANVAYPGCGFGSINFPAPIEVKRTYGIASYEVNQQ